MIQQLKECLRKETNPVVRKRLQAELAALTQKKKSKWEHLLELWEARWRAYYAHGEYSPQYRAANLKYQRFSNRQGVDALQVHGVVHQFQEAKDKEEGLTPHEFIQRLKTNQNKEANHG